MTHVSECVSLIKPISIMEQKALIRQNSYTDSVAGIEEIHEVQHTGDTRQGIYSSPHLMGPDIAYDPRHQQDLRRDEVISESGHKRKEIAA